MGDDDDAGYFFGGEDGWSTIWADLIRRMGLGRCQLIDLAASSSRPRPVKFYSLLVTRCQSQAKARLGTADR
jgi:hypothetical protein